MPKKALLTVDKILGIADLTEQLQDIYEHRHQIDQFFCVVVEKDSIPHFYWQGTNERLVYALEQAKLKILRPEDDDA